MIKDITSILSDLKKIIAEAEAIENKTYEPRIGDRWLTREGTIAMIIDIPAKWDHECEKEIGVVEFLADGSWEVRGDCLCKDNTITYFVICKSVRDLYTYIDNQADVLAALTKLPK